MLQPVLKHWPSCELIPNAPPFILQWFFAWFASWRTNLGRVLAGNTLRQCSIAAFDLVKTWDHGPMAKTTVAQQFSCAARNVGPFRFPTQNDTQQYQNNKYNNEYQWVTSPKDLPKDVPSIRDSHGFFSQILWVYLIQCTLIHSADGLFEAVSHNTRQIQKNEEERGAVRLTEKATEELFKNIPSLFLFINSATCSSGQIRSLRFDQRAQSGFQQGCTSMWRMRFADVRTGFAF